jgi:hypothetical protein
MHAPRIVAILVVLLGLHFQTGLAKAANLTLPKGGRVTIELLQSDAAFHNTLSILSPTVSKAITGCDVESVTGLSGVHLGSQKLSQRGCRIVLDADPGTNDRIDGFPDGKIIEFQLCAQIDADPACEFVWSSDPTKNSDGFDHLRITPLFEADYPNRIFRIEWEDLPNGGDKDFNDFIAVVRVDVDTDGDGLWDDWEKFGIDTDGDGTIDYDLPGEGADPNRRDIFVEIDYMEGGGHSHKPSQDPMDPSKDVIKMVTAAFSQKGIALHIDVDQPIPHQDVLNFKGIDAAGNRVATIGLFDDVKNQYFGKVAPFGPKANPRRFAFHYGLFTHFEVPVCNTNNPGCASSSPTGRAEIGGDDFYVSLGSTDGSVPQQAGTLMHELGHNLNLRHGGNTDTIYKPNYISVMNYFFQAGIPPTTRMDYSGTRLPDLDENRLNEPAGIGNGSGNQTRYYCPGQHGGTYTTTPGNLPINWNCDGDATDVALQANINDDCVTSDLPPKIRPCGLGTNTPNHTILTGYDDWSHLKYDFHTSGDYADGVHTTPELLEELTGTQLEQVQVLTVGIDIKPDGIPNSINIGSHGVIPVAILSSPTFNAVTAVDVPSLRFGRTGTEASLRFCSRMPVDVNADGLGDLFCHFETTKTTFESGDVQGFLSGFTTANLSFIGSDSVRIIGENGHHREHHHEHNREHDRDRDRDQKHDERDDRRH